MDAKGKEKADQPEPKRPRLELPIAEPKTPVQSNSTQNSSPLPFNSPREEVLDDRLCALSHEQLELLITRLARTDPNLNDKILRQIERLEHSMNLFSPRRTPATNLTNPALLMSPLMMGFAGMSGFGAQAEVNIKAIRRKVRGAFSKIKVPGRKRKRDKKDKDQPQKYKLQGDIIRKEMKKGKDQVLINGNNEVGLEILEAVTEEFTTFASEVGEENVDGFEDVLGDIAQDWVEVFLADSTQDMDDERSTWVNKLFVWDTSPDEAEGTFSAARAAAKLGWKDTQLQQVLAGNHIGKYTEPESLSIIRCNHLEREKKFEQALNLAKAVDLDHYTARYLIKVGRMEEALETARGIEDAGKIFSIAQVARAMDVSVAFRLCLMSIAVPHEWNNQNYERALWLVDLAVSQDMLDQLITEIESRVKHKLVQFEIAKILKEKTAFDAALKLATIVLKPWPKPEPMESDEQEQQQSKNSGFATLGELVDGEEVDPGSLVPDDVAQWMWETAHHTIELEVGTRERMDEVLDLILTYVEDVNILTRLAKEMDRRAEYEMIIKLGSTCLEILNSKLKKELEEQTKYIEEEFKILLQQEQAKKGDPPIESLPPRAIGYPQQFDRQKIRTCNSMLAAAFNSQEPIDPQVLLQLPFKIVREFNPISQDKIEEILLECMSTVEDPTHLCQLADTLRQNHQYQLVFLAGDRAQVRLQELNTDRIVREAWVEEYTELVNEQANLARLRKQLEDEKLEKLNQYRLKNSLLRIDPYYQRYTVSHIDNLLVSIARLFLDTAISSTKEEKEELRMSDEQISQVVLEKAINSGHVPSPTHRLDLLQRVFDQHNYYPKYIDLVLAGGDLIHAGIDQMREAFIKRETVNIPLNLLLQEQENLLQSQPRKKGKRKEVNLPDEKLAKIESLRAALSALPESPHYEPGSIASYESLSYRASSLILSVALHSRTLEDETLWLDADKIKSIITDIALVHNLGPDEHLNFMSTLGSAAQNRDLVLDYKFGLEARKMVFFIGKHIFDRLLQLDEDREKRFPEYYELKLLQAEQNDLDMRNKKLDDDKLARLEELEEKKAIRKGIQPFYSTYGTQKTHTFRFKCSEYALNSALTCKKTWEAKMDNYEELEDIDPADITEQKEERLAHLKEVETFILKELKDPKHLSTIGHTLKANKEIDTVIETVKLIQERGEALDELRKVREEWQARKQELEENKAELEARRKSLSASDEKALAELVEKQERLKLQPTYISTWNLKLTEKTYLNSAELSILALLDYRDSIQAALNVDAMEEEDSQTNIEELEIQKAEVKSKLDKVIEEEVVARLENPNYIKQIAELLNQHDEPFRVPPLLERAYTRLKELQKIRKEREVPIQWVSIFTEEESALEAIKKKLPKNAASRLKKYQEEIDQFDTLPDYANFSFANFDRTIHSICELALDNALNYRAEVRALMEDREDEMELENDDKEDVREKEKAAEELVASAIAFCKERLLDPNTFTSIGSSLKRRGEHELVLDFGLLGLEKVKSLAQKSEENIRTLREKSHLQQKESELERQRKALPKDEKERLRELEFESRLNNVILCNYERQQPHDYDSYCYTLAFQRIQASMDIKAERQAEMEADESLTMEQIEKETKQLAERVKAVVEESIEYVVLPQNLQNIFSQMYNMQEYDLTIIVGAKCQECIQDIQDQNDQRAQINQDIHDLQQQMVVAPEDGQKEELEELNHKLEELPLIYEQNYQLNNRLQQTASIMINAAKVEERTDVLRDQAVLRFKIQPSIQLFEEVKIMTEEDEWEEVRKELLEHITKPRPQEQNQQFGFANVATMDENQKVELLLNEGMWRQVVASFPEPPHGSLVMLERLYLEVEKNDPDSLDELVPLIEKYAIASYKDLDNLTNESLDRLLDSVQQTNPDIIYGIFSRGCEELVLNIVPKQYVGFVEYLKIFKRRLVEDLGRDDDWEAFIGEVVKKHKTKRKLMQMIQHSDLK